MDKRDKLGKDEINFAEFSMSLLADRSEERRTSFTVEDEIPDGRGGTIPRRLIVTSTEKHGLPTPFDDYVLIALIHLTRIKNDFQSPEVEYTRYEILSILGWNDSGRSYRRLDESLNRWTAVTLFYDQAWKEYRSNQLRSEKFHIIENISVTGDRYAFVWNRVVFRSLNSGYLRTLDLAVYFGLKSPVARKLYRFLNIHISEESPELTCDLATLAYCKVGLTRASDNAQLRRRLKAGIAELEQVGYIVPMTDAERFTKPRRGMCLVRFVFARPEPKISPVAALLIDQGISREQAVKLAGAYPEEMIRFQIEVLPYRLRENAKVASKTGFLIGAIRGGWEAPPSYIEAKRKEVRLQTDESLNREKAREKAERQKREDRIDDYLASLTQEEVGRIQDEVLKDNPPPHPLFRETYARLAVREYVDRIIG